MPRVITIVAEKFFNQFTNGETFSANTSDFSANLTGNVGEKVRATYQFEIGWEANADALDNWQVNAGSITRLSGNFREDGFQAGHTFDYISDWSLYAPSPTVEFNATIDSISADGRTIAYTVNSGIVPVGTQTDAGIKARGDASENYLTSLFWRWGLVANDAPYSNISNVTQNQQTYFAGGIGTGSPRSTTPVLMSSQGTYKDWVSGDAYVNFDSATDYTQIFQVSHDFIITPFYLDGQLEDLQNTVLPDYLEGENTLKYTFQAEFRQTLSNPNTAITATLDENLGSVGWFGENFNGFSSDYEATSIAYTDTATSLAVDALQSKSKTTVEVTINKLSGNFPAGQPFRVFVAYLATQEQYTNKTTELPDNFLYESLSNDEGAAAVNGSIITALEGSNSGGDLVITFDVEYTPLQQGYIGNGAYLIAVQVADETLSAQESDRVMILADAQSYISEGDVPDLHEFTKLELHFADSEIGTDAGTTDFAGFNEDALAVEFEFWLDLDAGKEAALEALEFALIAYNTTTGEYFDLDRQEVQIAPNTVVVSGVQQIEIDTQRQYLYEDGNQYRRIQLTTGSLIGTKQYYEGVFSQKIRWEDWIANIQADTVFYDNTQNNNNLNYRSGNYSGLLDYEIRFQVLATISGLDSSGERVETLYSTLSNNIEVGAYGDNADFEAVVALFDESGLNSTGGVIISNDFTLIRATFTTPLGAISDLTGYSAIIRIQVLNGQGQQNEEIATYYEGIGGVLVPKSGFTFVDLYLDAGNAVAECLIDGTKLTSSDWVITARLIAPDPPIEFAEFMNADNVLFMNGDAAKFMDQ